MAIAVMGALLVLALVLVFSRRGRETALILALTCALALHWMTVLVYIAKKGGIASEMQMLLFGVRPIRHWMQYLLVTLRQLGYAMAVGRYAFPLLLMWLALHYSYDPALRRRKWLYAAACVLPALSLVLYLPGVFEALIRLRLWMLRFLVEASLAWIAAYLIAVTLMLIHEYRLITMPFYRGQFGRKCALIVSYMLLYALYCPQDPAQVYLFYRNEYMGAVQGLWYLSPALNMTNYALAFALVVVCAAVGFHALMVCAQENLREDQEEIAIQRKFDAASKGASVFIHSVKNQLLANRVLLKRMDAELARGDIDRLREYHRSLSEANAMMLGRMEELYSSIKSSTITLVPTPLAQVCDTARERLLRKYPEARLDVQVEDEILVLCDAVHLAEAVYNLLTNAWEAQVSAGRTDTPVCVICQQARLWTVLEVRDCGSGISAHQKKQIFDPFYSSKNSNYNWGMGLYYVRAIVKSHLGLLRLETKPGKGSSFYLQLPRYGSGHPLPPEIRAQKAEREAMEQAMGCALKKENEHEA